MLRLLSSDYNNCWNMVCVSNIGNHALPVVGADMCKYLMNPWFLCTDRAYGPGIVIKSWQQEEHDFLSS